MNSLYPASIMLGVVSNVQDGPDGLFHHIEIKPVERYSQVEQVLIITQPDSVRNEDIDL